MNTHDMQHDLGVSLLGFVLGRETQGWLKSIRQDFTHYTPYVC